MLSEQCGEAIVFLVSFGVVILFKDPLQRHWSVVSVIELFPIENFQKTSVYQTLISEELEKLILDYYVVMYC